MTITETLRGAWKEITLLSTWLGAITGSFIIPLPSWTLSTDSLTFYTKGFIFFATVIAGYLIIYSLRNKNLKRWTRMSIIFFIFLILSYVTYNLLRENRTLPYDNKEFIIGTERIENNPLDKLEANCECQIDKQDILMHVSGQSERIWTSKSIWRSRLFLMIALILCYTFTSCFVISFSNTIILNKAKHKIQE